MVFGVGRYVAKSRTVKQKHLLSFTKRMPVLNLLIHPRYDNDTQPIIHKTEL